MDTAIIEQKCKGDDPDGKGNSKSRKMDGQGLY